jgi:hypothetical protein
MCGVAALADGPNRRLDNNVGVEAFRIRCRRKQSLGARPASFRNIFAVVSVQSIFIGLDCKTIAPVIICLNYHNRFTTSRGGMPADNSMDPTYHMPIID